MGAHHPPTAASVIVRVTTPTFPVTRADNVLKAVKDALDGYRAVINADVDFRSIHIDVKLDKDSDTVRTVVITTQGELSRR